MPPLNTLLNSVAGLFVHDTGAFAPRYEITVLGSRGPATRIP
jgi:hypothetical protein